MAESITILLEAAVNMNKKSDPQTTEDDNPEWVEADFKRARPGHDIFRKLGMEAPRPRGRPKSKNPKVQITLQLDQDIVEKFRQTGSGWQSRMNDALRKEVT